MLIADRYIKNIYHCPITGCWFWTAYITESGYARTCIKGRGVRVHKLFWEDLNGKVPDGLVLDHYRCNNRSCVNPEHVRPVSKRENALRGNNPASKNLAKMVCPACGGEYKRTNRGGRFCYKCWYENLAGIGAREYYRIRAHIKSAQKRDGRISP